jgi:predicted nicotinamide N-methyase
MLAGAHATTAPTPAPLLLTAGDGPWAWTKTRYRLLDGALDDKVTSYGMAAMSHLHSLGSAMRTQLHDDNAVAFEFEVDANRDDTPITLSLASYDDAGVGGHVWDAGVAMAILSKGAEQIAMPSRANARSKVLELGAGLGLPGISLSRHAGVQSVTLTDARPKLVPVLESNAAGACPLADVFVKTLEWGDGYFTGDPQLAAMKQSRENAHPAAHVAELVDQFDIVIGSDVCYEEQSVPHLASLLRQLHAPLSLLIGPATRPSMRKLAEVLRGTEGMHVEQRLVTLVCSDATDDSDSSETKWSSTTAKWRSGGVHMLLTVRQ